MFKALKLPPGRTTVMHLVARETLPEPNSHGEDLFFVKLFSQPGKQYVSAILDQISSGIYLYDASYILFSWSSIQLICNVKMLKDHMLDFSHVGLFLLLIYIFISPHVSSILSL